MLTRYRCSCPHQQPRVCPVRPRHAYRPRPHRLPRLLPPLVLDLVSRVLMSHAVGHMGILASAWHFLGVSKRRSLVLCARFVTNAWGHLTIGVSTYHVCHLLTACPGCSRAATSPAGAAMLRCLPRVLSTRKRFAVQTISSCYLEVCDIGRM